MKHGVIPSEAVVSSSAAVLQRMTFAYGSLMVLTALVGVALYVQTALWLHRVGNRHAACSCAQDWRRRYALWFPPAAVLASILIVPFLPAWLAPLVLLGLMVGWVVFMVSALQYLRKLRANNCTCAMKDDGLGSDALQVYAYIPLVSWSLSVLFMLALVVVFSFMKAQRS
jgi:hypothetical protein